MRRYAPGTPLPPYAFVPGQTPHPHRPGGHAHGAPPAPQELLDEARWRSCAPHLVAVDLFNHGYYWEAHEAWEGLWRAGGAAPVVALLQGLIRLAAAGVKLRQGSPESARRHAAAAAALLGRARAEGGRPSLCGVDLAAAAALGARLASAAEAGAGGPAPAGEATLLLDEA